MAERMRKLRSPPNSDPHALAVGTDFRLSSTVATKYRKYCDCKNYLDIYIIGVPGKNILFQFYDKNPSIVFPQTYFVIYSAIACN